MGSIHKLSGPLRLGKGGVKRAQIRFAWFMDTYISINHSKTTVASFKYKKKILNRSKQFISIYHIIRIVGHLLRKIDWSETGDYRACVEDSETV